ncbi:MAG: O-antigen ligase family protein, partial [Acidobacteria bacterium]|nr:O-antigen ligase family protein [Acidobacteriota bacterium]
GGVSALAFMALQIFPLPSPLVALLSPRSYILWNRAAEVINNGFPDLVPAWFTLSVDPRSTTREMIGFASRLAVFVLATQLFRKTGPKIALGTVLVGSAAFQVIYGIRHWSGGMMEIWGWTNRLIHGRMGGTFVNPNHLAHYLALVLPLSVFLLLHAWYRTRREPSLQVRVERFFTRHSPLVLIGGAGVFFATFGILLAKSRGVILAVSIAVIVGLTLFREESAARRGHAGRGVRRKMLVTALAVVMALGAAVLFLGTERVTVRMVPTRDEAVTLVGRVDGARIALDLWQMFPVMGSGFGTFENVALMVSGESGYYYRHAHNDWLEFLATTGLIGFGFVTLAFFFGLRAMARATWPRLNGNGNGNGSGSHRRFSAMGAVVILFVLLHALVDFNFYIPANSYTFAVIAGATVALPSRRR